MEPNRQPIPLWQMIESLFGARTTKVENEENTVIGVTPLRIAGNKPMRVGLIITNLSANSVFIAPSNQVAATRAIWLAPNGGFVSMVWDRDFELCCSEWWAVASAAGSQIYVLEIVNR